MSPPVSIEIEDGEGQPVPGERADIGRPELGMSTAIGEGETRAAARRVQHAEDSELLEDIGFVEAELQNPGKLQVCGSHGEGRRSRRTYKSL